MPSWATWISWGISIANFVLGLLGKKSAAAAPAPNPEYTAGQKAGATTQALADTQAALAAEQKVAQAEADTPNSQAAVVAAIKSEDF